jgi:hypothetical protein
VVPPGAPGAGDLPGIEGLPDEIRERLLKIRQDPTPAKPAPIVKESLAITVEPPEGDDIFRAYPDASVGWLNIAVCTIKRRGKKSDNKKFYLVGDRARTNPAVEQRTRSAVAILIVTAEGIPSVWIVGRPDSVRAPDSFKYDEVKWECAAAAQSQWVTLWWDGHERIHKWRARNLAGQPGDVPKWPAGHPSALILRAIDPLFIDDPNHPDFHDLLIRDTTS